MASSIDPSLLALLNDDLGGTPPPPANFDPPPAGPCEPWLTLDEVKNCCDVPDSLPDDKILLAINFASEYLWNRSGRRYSGICKRTVRPACTEFCCDQQACHCPDPCLLEGKILRLPGPVAGIGSVIINGTRLANDSYIVSGYRDLIRVDGMKWPCENDMTRSACDMWPPTPIQCDGETGICGPTPSWMDEALDAMDFTPPAVEPIVGPGFCRTYVCEDAPQWVQDYIDRLVCDEEAFEALPCPESPAWVNDYLIENNIAIIRGSCDSCCNAQGQPTNPVTRATYVCIGATPGVPTTVTQCCTDSPNLCCNADPDFVPDFRPNCCQKGGCGCTVHVVTTPGIPCPAADVVTQDLVVCDDWAAQYLQDNGPGCSNVQYNLLQKDGERGTCDIDAPLVQYQRHVPITNYGFVPLPNSQEFNDAAALGSDFCDTTAWEVTFYHGRTVPQGGILAALALVCEIVAGLCGSDNCRLPRNITYLQRQGVSVSVWPLHKLLGAGITGIWEVDMWLQSVNPGKLQRRGSMFDPAKMYTQSRVISRL